MRRRGKGRRRGRRYPDEVDARLEAVRYSSPKRSARGTKRRLRRRRKSPVVPLLLAVILLIGVLYGAYRLVGAAFGGGEEAAEQPVTVVVEQGDTLGSVAEKLDEAGVISSSSIFELEARVGGSATEIKPGEYQFEPGQSGEEILDALSSGVTYEVAIPEGLTLEQTAQKVAEQTGVPAEEFEAAAGETDYEYAFLDDSTIETTEGFLFPKKYEFQNDASAEQIVDRLLQQYLVETQNLDFAATEERLNLTEYEILTTASLIEKEAASPEEQPIIASVTYNRIRARMPLQIDATIHYALGEPKERLSLDDLEVDSPYNTYKNTGLPPGPIASPSRGAIQAALEPSDTEYLYYVLKPGGGEHFFTDDYDEFLEAKAEAEEER
ncbi:endolytic transglycosylase MltG [soil metagenome]